MTYIEAILMAAAACEDIASGKADKISGPTLVNVTDAGKTLRAFVKTLEGTDTQATARRVIREDGEATYMADDLQSFRLWAADNNTLPASTKNSTIIKAMSGVTLDDEYSDEVETAYHDVKNSFRMQVVKRIKLLQKKRKVTEIDQL